MKVLIISSVMPIRGGVTSVINALITKLKEKGYDSKCIYVSSGASDESKYLNSQVLGLITELLNLDIMFCMTFMLAKWILRYRARMELRTNDYSLVHVHDINAFNAVYSICKRRNIPVILNVHGHLYNGGTATRKIKKDSWLSRFLFRQEKKAYERAEKIIVVSKHSYETIKNITNEAKLYLIKNFVDTTKYYQFSEEERKELRKSYEIKEEDFVLIFAGRLQEVKGLIYILKGITLIHKKLSLKLLIAGDGPEKNKLSEYVKRNSLEDVILFQGEVDEKELLRLYNISDSYILASVSDEGSIEGTPMAVLEAMACGLPIITTAAGGIKDIITNEKNGLIIDERNENSIAEKIESLYNDVELRKRVSVNSLSMVKNEYRIEEVIKKIFKIYDCGINI